MVNENKQIKQKKNYKNPKQTKKQNSNCTSCSLFTGRVNHSVHTLVPTQTLFCRYLRLLENILCDFSLPRTTNVIIQSVVGVKGVNSLTVS